MNILMLCDEYPPGRHGGIGTVVQLLARTFVQQGHQVVVAGLYDWGYGQADYELDEGVHVYRFRHSLAGNWLQARDSIRVRIIYRLMRMTGLAMRDIIRSLKEYQMKLEALIRQYSIDIAEMPDFQEYAFHLTRYVAFPKLSIPVIVKLHGSLTYFQREAGKAVPAAIYESERQIVHQADAVCSVSRYTATQTARYMAYERPIKVLYNGLKILPLPVVKKDVNNVVFSGTLIPKKGIYQLMKAWNIVHEQAPDARLHIYGKGPVEKVSSLLSAAAKASVVFHGHIARSALLQALGSAGIAVFPSYAECFALAPMEAMVCGTAVVYSSRTSGGELITHGIDGLLCDPDDVPDLALQVVTLLANTQLRETISANGRRRVLEKFDIADIARGHIDYYTEIIQQHSGV